MGNLHSHQLIESLTGGMPSDLSGVVRLGIDIVHIPRIAESLRAFGERFEGRLFAPGEIAYSRSAPDQHAQRLAARFAAKEATIKAVGLSEAGVNWREMEVRRHADGSCELVLHGVAAQAARAAGIARCIVCLSHDGDYAAAVVAALSDRDELGR
ncbi:MAG TPA: holo-ACP synthase [Ramlibacter sp.]|jgi:holo-[acyl-carrier protein] synthase|uniref:holo-ACP synthase n=1 Tax=Ramlibacter sp. TaxID=1917967 RepID=UPI002D22C354|nr:holo-ACP synthase [Ramlibacter sp.]HZY19059.1 holo-ACP synthase [Ramlibacter sp.]